MSLSNQALLSDQIKLSMVHDADGSYDGTAQTMVDMRGFDGCLVLLAPGAVTAVGTHHITSFSITSNSAADGSGTDHTIVEAVDTEGLSTTAAAALTQADFGAGVPTTIGDTAMMLLDVKSEQLFAGDRYIAAELGSTGTFPVSVVYIRYNGTHNFKDMFQTTRTAFQFNGDIT